MLSADIAVKPTISLKYMVTKSKASGSTPIPFVKQFATGLKGTMKYFVNIYLRLFRFFFIIIATSVS